MLSRRASIEEMLMFSRTPSETKDEPTLPRRTSSETQNQLMLSRRAACETTSVLQHEERASSTPAIMLSHLSASGKVSMASLGNADDVVRTPSDVDVKRMFDCMRVCSVPDRQPGVWSNLDDKVVARNILRSASTGATLVMPTSSHRLG